MTRPLRLAPALLLAIGMLAAACGDDGASTSSSTSSSSSSTSVHTTSTSPPTVTQAPSSTTTTSTTAPIGAPGRAPTPVAGPGGGSGEVSVRWSAVDGATGYRVQRALSATGDFEVTADIDTTTGYVTLTAGATNLWSPTPGSFEYVEVVTDGSAAHYFRVVAYDDGGEGPPSTVVCGAPPGSTGCES